MHQITHRWKLGLILSLTTAVMWGLLPIAIKELLKTMDPWTITFYRFFGATVLMGLYLLRKKQLPRLKQFTRPLIGLLSICIIGLCANYIFFLFGLALTTPTTTQVLIQLAPMILLFGGLFIFKERFSFPQWLGFMLFFVGLLLFFNKKLIIIFQGSGDYALGVFYIIIASVTWAAYALAQKQLLKDFSSIAIMFMILTVGSFGFFSIAQLNQIYQLNMLGLGMLIFSSLNTAIAYGAFAEALNHWEASRVSAILSLTPVITVISLELLSTFFHGYFQMEKLSWLTISGILVVVVGSMLTALGKKAVSKNSKEVDVREQPTADL
ncbi:MAG TPA: DMT family transporter [Aeromonadales bacterium]|nr:DMT family transporter [Aeromonadales bacterium]